MAISENRLSERNLVGLTTTDFIGSTDTGEDQPSNEVKRSNDNKETIKSKSNQQARSLGKKTVFDKGIGNTLENDTKNVDNLLAKINHLDTTLAEKICNASIVNGKIVRLPENRELDKIGLGIRKCPNGEVNLSIDSILQSTLFDSKGIVLSDNGLYTLEQIISKEFSALSGFSEGLTKAFKSANKSIEVINSVISLLDTIGGTLNQKINIINPAICDMTLPTYTIGDLDFLKKFTLGLVFNISDCANLDKLLGFVEKLLGSGHYTQGEIMSSMLSTFSGTYGDAAIRKVKIISALATSGGILTDKDSIHTKGKANIILNSIADTTSTTNSPVSEYYDMTESLDNIDSTWNKDSEGNIDYSKVGQNRYMNDLSKKTITSTSDFDGNPTLTPIDKSKTATIKLDGDQTSFFKVEDDIELSNGSKARIISTEYDSENNKTILTLGSIYGENNSDSDILLNSEIPVTNINTIGMKAIALDGDQTNIISIGNTVTFDNNANATVLLSVYDHVNNKTILNLTNINGDIDDTVSIVTSNEELTITDIDAIGMKAIALEGNKTNLFTINSNITFTNNANATVLLSVYDHFSDKSILILTNINGDIDNISAATMVDEKLFSSSTGIYSAQITLEGNLLNLFNIGDTITLSNNTTAMIVDLNYKNGNTILILKSLTGSISVGDSVIMDNGTEFLIIDVGIRIQIIEFKIEKNKKSDLINLLITTYPKDNINKYDITELLSVNSCINNINNSLYPNQVNNRIIDVKAI